MKYPWLTERQISAAASRLLCRAFGQSYSPVAPVDLEAIIFDCLSEEENLIFDDQAVLESAAEDFILGKTQPIAGKILINRALGSLHESGRRRFTIAHELGHWILHRPLFIAARENLDLFAENDLATVSLVDRDEDIFGIANGMVRPEEWQANRFARCLLIDGTILRFAFAQRFGEPPVAWQSHTWRRRSSSLREHSRLLSRSSPTCDPPLKDLFGVSAEAMAIALEEGGYTTESEPAF
jgi:Zn-dependent peptidase ImmA (M78 family)